jgi:hypothetical protein
MQQLTLNQVVAMLGLILAVSVYLALRRFGFPEKICWGASILSILIVAIFWTSVMLGAEDDDD